MLKYLKAKALKKISKLYVWYGIGTGISAKSW